MQRWASREAGRLSEPQREQDHALEQSVREGAVIKWQDEEEV